MTAVNPAIVLGSVQVPITAALGFSQRYEPIEARSMRRRIDGSLSVRIQWSRLRTVITCNGWIPPGLEGLDYSQSMTLKCGAPRGITSQSNVIAVPAARRSDAGFGVIGFAEVDKAWRETPVALAGDTATLTVVTGAARYRVLYYPQLTVFATPPRETHQRDAATVAWELTAEEI